jgi:metal-sulfur cluster biosynthetic enzyme
MDPPADNPAPIVYAAAAPARRRGNQVSMWRLRARHLAGGVGTGIVACVRRFRRRARPPGASRPLSPSPSTKKKKKKKNTSARRPPWPTRTRRASPSMRTKSLRCGNGAEGRPCVPLFALPTLHQPLSIPVPIPHPSHPPSSLPSPRTPHQSTHTHTPQHIRGLADPEHPYTLEQLGVVSPGACTVDDQGGSAAVAFTPTVPHCSMATLIGLALSVRLKSSLPPRFKVRVGIAPGAHSDEAAINKQLADKERVAAALENPNLRAMVGTCLAGVGGGGG